MEWKDFELRCLPDLTKVYEFQKRQGEGADSDWFDWELENVEAVCELDIGELIRYRKVEPKAPTSGDLQKRIDSVKNYLNCGFVHEYKTIIGLLNGETYE